MVPVLVSARAAKQNISWVWHISSLGFMSSTCALASRISAMLLLVDWIPWRMRCICPLSVAVEGGRCFLMSSWVRPGKDDSWPLLMAFSNVDLGGEHRLWCMYCASSALVVHVCRLAAISLSSVARWVGSMVGWFVFDSLRGTIHSPVRVHFLPQSTVRPR